MNNIEQLKELQQQAKANYDFKALREINEQIFKEREQARTQAKREREQVQDEIINVTILKLCKMRQI